MSRPRRPWRLVAAPGGWVRVEPHAGGRWRVRMLVDEEPVSEFVDALEDVGELLGEPLGDWAYELEREPTQPRFDPRPLIVAAGGVTELARRAGMTRSAVDQAMRNGARPWTADRLACALGFHPWEVWGDSWWADLHAAA